MLTLSLDEKSGDLDTDSLAAAGIGPLVGSNGHSYAPRRNRATGSTIAGWRGFIDGAIEQGIIAGRAAAGILGK